MTVTEAPVFVFVFAFVLMIFVLPFLPPLPLEHSRRIGIWQKTPQLGSLPGLGANSANAQKPVQHWASLTHPCPFGVQSCCADVGGPPGGLGGKSAFLITDCSY